mmetsp:Transcript_10731/g.16123  ORF Transcript_10731/g.16123 Transcript_10731/m.16123 type:complete len:631 (+) Transcript_10731:184-2076(+)
MNSRITIVRAIILDRIAIDDDSRCRQIYRMRHRMRRRMKDPRIRNAFQITHKTTMISTLTTTIIRLRENIIDVLTCKVICVTFQIVSFPPLFYLFLIFLSQIFFRKNFELHVFSVLVAMSFTKIPYDKSLINELIQMNFSMMDIMAAVRLYPNDRAKVIEQLQQRNNTSRPRAVSRGVQRSRSNCVTLSPEIRRTRVISEASRASTWDNLYESKSSESIIEKCVETKEIDCDTESIQSNDVDVVECFDVVSKTWMPARILIPVDDTQVCVELLHSKKQKNIKIVSVEHIRAKLTPVLPSLCGISADCVAENRDRRTTSTSSNQSVKSVLKKLQKKYVAFGTKYAQSSNVHHRHWSCIIRFASLAIQVGLNFLCPGLSNLLKAVHYFVRGDKKKALLNVAFGIAQILSLGIAQIDSVDEFCSIIWGGLSEIKFVRDIAETMLTLIKPVAQYFVDQIDVFFDEIGNEVLSELQTLLHVYDVPMLNKCFVKPLKTYCCQIAVSLDKLEEAAADDVLDDKLIAQVDKYMCQKTHDLLENLPQQMTKMLARTRPFNVSKDDIQKCELMDMDAAIEEIQQIITQKVIRMMPSTLDKDIDIDVLNQLSIFNVFNEDIVYAHVVHHVEYDAESLIVLV